MSSKTNISNLAISHLGVGKEIANMTERSQEASSCNRYFDIALNKVLEDFNWSFVKKTQVLNLISEEYSNDLKYSYRAPSDCLKVVKILSGLYNESVHEQVYFKTAKDDQGKIIITNQPLAEVEYIEDTEDINLLPSGFALALSYKLAELIAPRLSKGDPYKNKRELRAAYEDEIETAKKNDANQQPKKPEPESEFIKARY